MRKFLIPLILTMCIVGLRIPNFYEPHWYDDEEIYLTIGHALQQGSQLYTTITDNKPPLLYWWVSINPSLIWLKSSIALFAVLSTLFLLVLVKAMKMRSLGQIIAIICFILLINLPSFEGNIFNAELMFLPLVILSYYYTWQWIISRPSIEWTKMLLIGSLAGCASIIKIPAAADFAAIIFITLISTNHKIYTYIKLCIGFLIPWLLVGSYFMYSHSFGEFIYNSFLYNFKYIQDWNQISHSAILTAISPLYVRIALLSLGIVSVYIALLRKKIDASIAFILIWFFCSWFGSILSLRPYPHYLLQLTPSFSLLAAYAITANHIKTKIALAGIIMAVSVYIYSIPFIPYRTQDYYHNWWQYITRQISAAEYTTWFDQKLIISTDISNFINAHANKTDQLFIWGNIAAIYSQTNLSPATPYATDYLIHSYQAYRDVEKLLTSSPPQWIVDCKSSTIKFPALNQLTDTQYYIVKSSGNCDLYHHRPLPMLQ